MDQYTFALFVIGQAATSEIAERNLRALCARHLPQRHALEVIDVAKNPELAEAHRILATPTLIKLTPAPIRLILGDLSDTQRVLAAIGLPTGS